MTKEELEQRAYAVRNAIASQRLEGLEPDSQVIEDLERFARGEIEIEAAIGSFKARIASGEFDD